MDGRTSQTHKKTAVLILLACAVVLAAFGCLMVGSSGMTVSACLDALLGRTGGTAARIIWGIRIPRLLAALLPLHAGCVPRGGVRGQSVHHCLCRRLSQHRP